MRAGDWWEAVGQESARAENDRRQGRDPGAGIVDGVHLLHDVTPDVLALLTGDGPPAGSLFAAPFPLDGWPDLPITVLVGREDRLFPLSLQRRVARKRLGLEVIELPGGHLAALSQPDPVADALLAAAALTPAG